MIMIWRGQEGWARAGRAVDAGRGEGVADSFKTGGGGGAGMGGMSIPDIDAAEQFIAAHGRVVDRRRFERLMRDGQAQPVRDAVAAYRNPDGGFGHALEPDGRAPGSQPLAVDQALRILHEADAWSAEMAAAACDWLQATAPADGGAAAVDPSIEGWPHAPWWVRGGGQARLARHHRPHRRDAARPRGAASVAGAGHRGDVVADRRAVRGWPV